MIPVRTKAAAISLFFLPTMGLASEVASADGGQKPFILPSGVIPAQIFGNDCVQKLGDGYFAPMLSCEPKKVTENPTIAISVIDSTCGATSEHMMAGRRNSVNDDTPFFNVVWEESFVPPSVPGGVGYRAFYQTSLGNRYWCEACGQGKLTRVSVIMFAPLDNDALKAEIEEKIFGVMPSSPPVSQDMKP